MPRTAKIVIANEPVVYHIMSRKALDRFPLGLVEKDCLLDGIKFLSRLYFTDILRFCIMGNHFHILLEILQDTAYNDEDIETRGL